MAGFIEGVDRGQSVLFPDRLDDWIGEDSLVRVVDLFVEELDLQRLGFARSAPARTGRPGYHPAVLLKLFIYGYLNRIPSSRRLEREAGRNVEVMWLTGKLMPDHKTIADFRKDHGDAIRKVCREFVLLCRRLKLFADGIVAIDAAHDGLGDRGATVREGTDLSVIESRHGHDGFLIETAQVGSVIAKATAAI